MSNNKAIVFGQWPFFLSGVSVEDLLTVFFVIYCLFVIAFFGVYMHQGRNVLVSLVHSLIFPFVILEGLITG